jgi:hypothetical protein
MECGPVSETLDLHQGARARSDGLARRAGSLPLADGVREEVQDGPSQLCIEGQGAAQIPPSRKRRKVRVHGRQGTRGRTRSTQ